MAWKMFCVFVSRLQRETARILGMVSLCVVIPGALAAGYPERPVRVIVPSPPGGGTDTSTRIITPKLSEILGQQFIVDNRGGASGNIGAGTALHAAPDGYTLLATLSSHASNPSVMKSVPIVTACNRPTGWPISSALSSMMQNAINTGLFVIPAHAGIQNSLFFLVQESWTPDFSGVTNRFTSSC